MKQQLFKYSLAFLSLFFAFLLWNSVDRAINIEEASTWLMPIIWSSLFFIFFSLLAVLVKRKWILDLLFLACFLLVLIFAFNFVQTMAVLASLLFGFLAIGKFRRDMNLNIKIDLRKTLGTGKSIFVLALALTISVQYYSGIRDAETKKIFPRLKMGSLTSSLTNNILKMVNPDFANVETDSLTVDQFILQIQKDKSSQMEIDPQIGELNKIIGEDAGLSQLKNDLLENSQEQFIQEGRAQFSEIVGRKLTGQEKVSDIFSELINKKIDDFISPNLTEKGGFPIVPFILAILLFLTILPMGTFFFSFWTWVCFFLFLLAKKLGLVTVNKIPAEIEVIE